MFVLGELCATVGETKNYPYTILQEIIFRI